MGQHQTQVLYAAFTSMASLQGFYWPLVNNSLI